MNKFTANTFNTIKSAATDYQSAVQSALLDYRRTMERVTAESKQYKDENAFIAPRKAAARKETQAAIKLAENAFTGAVKAEYESLKGDLHDHLTTRPAAAFLDAVRLYHDFNITPSHTEIEALMTLNGGCPLGYRVINRTLEKTGAEWRIDAPDSAAYEADLAVIQNLSYGNIMYAPHDCHHEAVEVYGGEQRLQMREDGTTYFGGYKWDSVGILMSTGNFTEKIKSLDTMADRWSSTILPSMKHIDAYEDKTDPETGETVETAADQLRTDFKATARAPEIEQSEQPEVEAARRRAHEQTETAAKAAEGLKRFML